MTALRALLVLGLAQAGCAATSGQEWLNAPVDQPKTSLPASAEATEIVSGAPPRLSHTVTLGESYTATAAPAAPGVVGVVGGPTVQVNVPLVINNYAGYGSAYGYGGYAVRSYGARNSVFPVRATNGTSQKVGADFPAVPDYGPRAMK